MVESKDEHAKIVEEEQIGELQGARVLEDWKRKIHELINEGQHANKLKDIHEIVRLVEATGKIAADATAVIKE